LSGSDTRSTKLSTSRSDVNILAFVNPTSKQVLLLNTPRDYYVPISISSSGTRDKLTHCGIYGVDCSMDTLGALYDTSVDYYMQVNFEGFKTLVDAIGGIEVESDQSFVTTHYDVQIYKGTNYLDGTGALGFVRERYAFSDGDNARGRNTMKVVKAIIDKMSSGTTILSNYSAIMKSMEGMFVTNMSSDEIADLVRMQLSDMSSWDVRQYAVIGTGDSRTTYSVPNQKAYVMIPDEDSVDKAKELIEKMESGELLTDADFE
jgi:LCP family protein required for cell wall assembly